MKSNKVHFRVLSDKTCIKCGKRLKQNLVNRKSDARLCYKCYTKVKKASQCESTDYAGINYALNTGVNKDKDTGIVYGIIDLYDVLQAWADSSEPYYPCDECEYKEDADIKDFSEDVDDPDNDEEIEEARDSYGQDKESSCDMCEPSSHYFEDNEYSMETCFDGTQINVYKSPYFTFTQYCSPCAPGAGNLNAFCGNGVKTYCLGHDWFDDEKAPYPVFSVKTGKGVKS